MELIELDATAQRALELLTNAGMSDGSIYDYTHTGFGSILRHFHTKGILYATAEMLDNFLLEQRVLLDQGDISQWKWGLVRRSCELLKQCAAMNSIDLPDLQPWDPVWNRPKQIIQHDAPTAKQFAESENIYVLVWMVNKRMEQLGLSENTVRHYTEEGLAVILKKHYDSGTESYSDKLISQLTDERRLQYEQGEVGRTTYQNLRKAAAMLQEFRLTGKITLERIPNWGRREVIPQHKAILDKFSAHVTTQSNWAESSVSTVTSVARVFLLELEDHGINKRPYVVVHTRKKQKDLKHFSGVFERFDEMLCKQSISDGTRKLQDLYCYEFLHFVEQQGISDLKEINAQILYAAFSASGSKENFRCAVRKLMKYLYQEQIHPLNLAEFVPAVRRAKPMPTVYSKDEIQKLLNVVDKSTDKGLRDRAMLLLAARLGIRTSDICNLKKKNIHWDTNTIEFVQKKTGVSARLELLPDVKEALLAYLTKGRPSSDSENIFLRVQCPFTPIGQTVAHHEMSRYLAKAGIDTDRRKTGPHALRMSLATELVAEDIPYSVVQKVLGHQSSLCFNNYVRLDIENLRRCAVAVPPATDKLKEWLSNMGRVPNEK